MILNLKTSCIFNRAENQNINMRNCLFQIVSSIGNGGAIYINTNISLHINDTTFYECKSTASNSFRGAIYFSN